MEVKADVNIDLAPFQEFLKNVETYHAKVGVLGEVTVHGKSQNVASYGMVHEFGSISRNIPRRSFLKDPLKAHAKEEIKKVEAIIIDKLVNKDVKGGAGVLGLKGVEIVKRAFQTSNDGKWAPLSQSTIDAMTKERRKGWKILVDEGTLMGSISFRVDKDDKRR